MRQRSGEIAGIIFLWVGAAILFLILWGSGWLDVVFTDLKH